MPFALDREETETRAIHDLMDFDGRDVLEVGCGDGRLTWRYADRAASVLAWDPNEAEIALARERMSDHLRHKVEFHVADVTTTDLPQSAFDVVLFSWSLC